MCTRSWILIPLLILIGSLADKRTLIAIPLVLVFKFFQGSRFMEFASCRGCFCLLHSVCAWRAGAFLKELWPWVVGFVFVFVLRASIKSGVIGPGIDVAEYGSGLSLFSAYALRMFSINGLADLFWMYLQGFRWAWLIVFAYFLYF